MRLYEYEAKKVFSLENIPIPRNYGTMTHPTEILEHAGTLEFPLMLKAQVLLGGRGKAGGIQLVGDIAEAEAQAHRLLNMEVQGCPVQRVMVEQRVLEKAAFYAGVTMSPANFNNVFAVSAEGGVDIERVSRTSPERLLKVELPQNERTLPDEIRHQLTGFCAASVQLQDWELDAVGVILSELYELYQKYDCRIAEINPLILTPEGPVAADAKIVLDDNGLYRQRDLLKRLGLQEVRHDVAEPTPNEFRARASGFPFVDLLPQDLEKDPDKLYVGLVPGGAGYGIFSIDEVANIGREHFQNRVVPVNFMDSGGGPSLSRVAEMFHLLMDWDLVDLVITSRFGGISSCDTFIRGLVEALRGRHREGRRMVPVFGRMVGTDLANARTYLEKAKQETPEELRDLHIYVGNQIIMAKVIQEALEEGLKSE